jgi:hypothetical protein
MTSASAFKSDAPTDLQFFRVPPAQVALRNDAGDNGDSRRLQTGGQRACNCERRQRLRQRLTQAAQHQRPVAEATKVLLALWIAGQ